MLGPVQCGYNSGHDSNQHAIRQMVFLNELGLSEGLQKIVKTLLFRPSDSMLRPLPLSNNVKLGLPRMLPLLIRVQRPYDTMVYHPRGLAVAVGSLYRNRLAGFRKRKFTMEQ